MLIKIDHIAYGAAETGDALPLFLDRGYRVIFQEHAIANPFVKSPLLAHFSPIHDTAFLGAEGRMNIEIVAHGVVSGHSGYVKSCVGVIGEECRMIAVPLVNRSSAFWQMFGFTVLAEETDNATLQYCSLFHPPLRLVLRKTEETLPSPLLDDEGENCIGFITTNIEQEVARFADAGYFTTPIAPVTMHGRPIRIAFVRGPAGELTELIQVV